MLLWEFNARVKGLSRKEDRQWHKVRVLASILLQPHMKKGRTIKPQDIIPLPDDVRVPERRMTPEQVEEDINRKMKIYRKVNG